jgi:glycosyltransferase involved in cell wall biosynthesis
MEVIRRVNDKWLASAGGDVIQLVGHVTESQKWSLLKHASVLMFVSWEEGFGLPLLEALAVGTPVIASNQGSLPEIAGDVAIMVEPNDIEQMSLAIAQCVLVPDGARALQEEAKQHAAEFTWERAAEATLRVIESVVV